MKMIDLTGQRYGKLVVIGRSEEKSGEKILWDCKCDCGNLCKKTKDVLMKPTKRLKACSIRCSSSIPIGTKIGKLTVLELIAEEGQETKYKCKCDCGNIVTVDSLKLKNKTTKSCGCYRKERMSEIGKNNSSPADITGQRFGLLVAIEPIEERINRSIVWKCQCDCGNVHYASENNLKSGSVTRCNNCHISSKGEEIIANILLKNNIPFEREKSFMTCKFKDTNRLARFDFFVDNKYIIEFDGIQHYPEGISSGWATEEFYKKNKMRDAFKNQWCKDNNIPLIRIPYTHKDLVELKDLKLETSTFLIF